MLTDTPDYVAAYLEEKKLDYKKFGKNYEFVEKKKSVQKKKMSGKKVSVI